MIRASFSAAVWALIWGYAAAIETAAALLGFFDHVKRVDVVDGGLPLHYVINLADQVLVVLLHDLSLL